MILHAHVGCYNKQKSKLHQITAPQWRESNDYEKPLT